MGPAGTAGTFQASYDAESRQTKVTDASSTVTTYVYDGLGQRVQRGSNIYVYDVAGNLSAEYTTALPSTQACSTCYVTPDALGSMRLVTNDGPFVARHDFAAFGEELFTTNRTNAIGYGIADSMTHLYTGKERDSETGLDFFGARYRSAFAGRFTTRDPGSFGADWSRPQTWNGYSFVHNNPTSYIDPRGLGDEDPGEAGAGSYPIFITIPGVTFYAQAEAQALKDKAAKLQASGKEAVKKAPCLANVKSFVNASDAKELAKALKNGVSPAEVLATSGDETLFGSTQVGFANVGNFFGLHGTGPAGSVMASRDGPMQRFPLSNGFWLSGQEFVKNVGPYMEPGMGENPRRFFTILNQHGYATGNSGYPAFMVLNTPKSKGPYILVNACMEGN